MRIVILILLLSTFVLAQSNAHVSLVSVDDDSDLVTIVKADVTDPFSKKADICFSLKESVHVSVRIVTPQGDVVRQLLSTELAAGTHRLTWDGKNDDGNVASSGVFVYEIQTKQMTRTAMLALLN